MSERGTSIIFWLISIILFLSPFIFIKKDKRVRPIIINQIESKKIEYNNGIQVHIVGAIENPGIYTVKVGTKLYELLNVIQLQSSASTSHLNLARTLRDGQRIVIKEIKDIRLININLATKNDLKQIPVDSQYNTSLFKANSRYWFGYCESVNRVSPFKWPI